MPRQRNLLSAPRPTTTGQWLCLIVSYAPPLLALIIQLSIMVPYLEVFCYDYLVAWEGAVPFAVLCGTLGIAFFGLLLASFLMVMFIPPGYVDPRVWRARPRYVPLMANAVDGVSTTIRRPLRSGGPQPDVDKALDDEVFAAINSGRAVDMAKANGVEDPLDHVPVGSDPGGGTAPVTAAPVVMMLPPLYHNSVVVGTNTNVRATNGRAHTPPSAAAGIVVRRHAPPAEAGGPRDEQSTPTLINTPSLFRSTRHSVSSLTEEGQLRYCHACDLYKPDDAHHCKDCNRCVRRMEYHCPWINNCVGADNLKFFFLFLIYIPVCATYVIVTIWYGTTRVGVTTTTDVNNNPLLFTKLAVIVLAAGTIGVVLGGFACLTCYFTVSDEATLQRLAAAASPAGRRRSNATLTPDSTPESGHLTGPTGATSRRRGCLANCRRNMSRERILSAWRRFLGPDWRLWAIPVVSARPFGEQEGELAL